MGRIKLEKSIEIKAGSQAIFDFITNPANMPLILPGLKEIVQPPELPLKPGSHFAYKYRMAGVTLNGVWTVDEIKSPSLYKAHTKGLGESVWTQEIVTGNGLSIFNLSLEYVIPAGVLSPLKAKALAAVNERDMDEMLARLKTILESGEKPTPAQNGSLSA